MSCNLGGWIFYWSQVVFWNRALLLSTSLQSVTLSCKQSHLHLTLLQAFFSTPGDHCVLTRLLLPALGPAKSLQAVVGGTTSPQPPSPSLRDHCLSLFDGQCLENKIFICYIFIYKGKSNPCYSIMVRS